MRGLADVLWAGSAFEPAVTWNTTLSAVQRGCLRLLARRAAARLLARRALERVPSARSGSERKTRGYFSFREVHR